MNIVPKKLNFINEPILKYDIGSKERIELEKEMQRMKEDFLDIPLIIGGKEIRTGNKGKCIIPHDNKKVIGEYHEAGVEEVKMAIEAADKAKSPWQNLDWESRVSIFVKAAELASGPWRAKLNAATMLTQSKTFKQAEIDSACEFIDFLNYNAFCLHEIYSDQPISSPGVWNKMDYRPLEGFVFAVSPFNFTAIGGNLCSAPALTGNTVLWKPSSTAVYSNYIVYKLFEEAGLPDGVINFIPGKSSVIGDLIMTHEDLAGVHFTGSTKVFQGMWKTIGDNIENYKTFPRIVGETGGKNYIVAHKSANVEQLSTAMIEGSFEYQGQKCSASSRVYIPKGLWPEVKENFLEKLSNITIGDVNDFTNFMGAVIDQKSFDNIISYFEYTKNSDDAEIIFGGTGDDSKGFFIQPTVILTTNPDFKTMKEEIFGPVLTVYIYEDEDYEETLRLCDKTSKYGLTGSIFAKDVYAIEKAKKELVNTSGNFYINFRPTGAVVGQQPFGGARLSGTNDKAGSKLNLFRWISPRAIKENIGS